MTFEQFARHIKDSIQTRFRIESPNVIQTEMLDLTPQDITNKQVLRFCRPLSSDVSSQFGKTLLVTGIDPDQIRDILQWAALCKEVLLDPETSDVYLFIMWLGENIPSIEECLRIEANEDFCRKFVLRPNETIESFIERTFLKKIDAPEPLDLGQDPLISAFSGLEEHFSWFDHAEKNRWKEAFNSGASGSDLFDALITHKPENNEAS
jgi:hypothetical protein